MRFQLKKGGKMFLNIRKVRYLLAALITFGLFCNVYGEFSEGFESEESLKEWKESKIKEGNFEVSLDNKIKHSGNSSLNVKFDLTPEFNFYHFSRSHTVQPDTEYIISAYIKTDLNFRKVTFEIVDGRGYKHLCENAGYPKSTQGDWEKITAKFRTKPDTQKITVRLRKYGRKGEDTGLKGQLWLDDIILEKTE
jgi:hypothetical protein